MPITVIWDNAEKTILRQVYEGKWSGKEFVDAFQETNAMMRENSQRVDIILDFVNADFQAMTTYSPAANWSEVKIPENLGAVIMVKADSFIKVLTHVGRRIAPKLTASLHFASTLDEAYSLAKDLGANASAGIRLRK